MAMVHRSNGNCFLSPSLASLFLPNWVDSTNWQKTERCLHLRGGEYGGVVSVLCLPFVFLNQALGMTAAKLLQACPTLCNPTDGSPPGSPVPGILQAGTLVWVAISFSNAWKWKVKVKSLGHVRLLATPWTAAHQAPPSMGFPRQEYWCGVPVPSPSAWLLRVYELEAVGLLMCILPLCWLWLLAQNMGQWPWRHNYSVEDKNSGQPEKVLFKSFFFCKWNTRILWTLPTTIWMKA